MERAHSLYILSTEDQPNPRGPWPQSTSSIEGLCGSSCTFIMLVSFVIYSIETIITDCHMSACNAQVPSLDVDQDQLREARLFRAATGFINSSGFNLRGLP